MDMTSPASKRTFNVSKDSAEAMQCLCSYLTRTTPERRDVLLLTLNTFITKFTSMEHKISLQIQLAFTYSKRTLETPDQCLKEYVQC